MTGNCIGIDGIAGFSNLLNTPAPSLKSRDLKKHDLKEWQRWQKTGIFKKDEGIIGIGSKASNHAKLDKELKELKNFRKQNLFSTCPPMNQKTQIQNKTKSRFSFHAEYISCLEKLGELKAELDMIIIQFKLDCKRRKGIKDVFKYIRTDNNTEFDKKSFSRKFCLKRQKTQDGSFPALLTRHSALRRQLAIVSLWRRDSLLFPHWKNIGC